MATIVPKGANRASAYAKTKKHAQRTPLPPRPGQIDDAREVLEMVRKPYGEMNVKELKEAAKALGVDPLPARKGELMDAILEAEKAKAGRTAKAASKPTSATVAKTEPSTKSEAKAADFAAVAANLGWSLDLPKTDGERTDLTVRRGDETIDLAWEAGVFQHPCLYSFRGRTIQLRNASAAKQRMALDPAKAEEETERVVVRKVNAEARRSGTPKVRKLPFDPETSTDAEVLSAVQGKRIFWENGISGQEESDSVPARSKSANRPKIHEGPNGRILTFAGHSGFRSVLVSKIVAVK